MEVLITYAIFVVLYTVALVGGYYLGRYHARRKLRRSRPRGTWSQRQPPPRVPTR
jgi:cytochrome bd-type quinol oxidase subunit 1